MVLAEDGRKMSKSFGNTITPDEVVEKYGADTLRTYEMFMGPFADTIPWSNSGLIGVRKFLDRVCRLKEKVVDIKPEPELLSLLHKAIKKVGEDIEDFHFNTAVSALMILSNELTKLDSIPKEVYRIFLLILSPFAAHLTEELWHSLGEKQNICLQDWPAFDQKLIVDNEVELVVQINGKVRDRFNIAFDVAEEAAVEVAKKREKISPWILNQEIIKIVFVKNKLINIVIKQ
jgi:leucyl-tRNA synthetase